MSTLYRKYRPQTFAELVGQNHVKITLQHELETGQIGHAYLFCGPRGLGKTTVARLFAKAVNCLNRKEGESEPCNQCSSCLNLMANRSVDVIEIDAASSTSVDNVRENIIENSRFTPTQSKYKVFIIDEVHMLSNSAFNALLKTLEEPPVHVIFILCTTETHKVPQTIISRCQRFDLKMIASDEMLTRLKMIVKAEEKKVPESVLKNIIAHSDGCLRDAESLLGKILSLGDDITEAQAEIVLPRSDFGSVVSFLEYLADNNATAAVEIINKLIEDGVDLQIFAESTLEFLRKVMLLKINGNLAEYGVELDETSEKAANLLATRFDYPKLISLIELLLAKSLELKTAPIQQLPLEMLAITICQNISCRRDDDFDTLGGGVGVKDKVREKLVGLGVTTKPVEAKIIKEEIKIMPVAPVAENLVTEKKTVELADIAESSFAVEPVITETAEAPAEAKPIPDDQIGFGVIKGKWQEIVDSLYEKNFTLSSTLKLSQPRVLKSGMLTVATRSNFYKTKIEDSKSRVATEDAIANICGFAVGVKAEVDENLPQLKLESTNAPVFGSPAPAAPQVKFEPVAKPQAPTDPLAEAVSLF